MVVFGTDPFLVANLHFQWRKKYHLQVIAPGVILQLDQTTCVLQDVSLL